MSWKTKFYIVELFVIGAALRVYSLILETVSDWFPILVMLVVVGFMFLIFGIATALTYKGSMRMQILRDLSKALGVTVGILAAGPNCAHLVIGLLDP